MVAPILMDKTTGILDAGHSISQSTLLEEHEPQKLEETCTNVR